MSDEPNPEVDAIFQQAAIEHERFVAESKEIDSAWADGTLSEWLRNKLDRLKKGDSGDDNDNESSDVPGGDTGGAPA